MPATGGGILSSLHYSLAIGMGEVYLQLGRCVFLISLTIGSMVGHRAFNEQTDGQKNSGTEVFEPGGDVRAPKLIHYVEPEYTTGSKEAFVEGVVKISTVVTTEGLPTKCKVTKGLGEQVDKAAMEALKEWRFRPGTKEGKPVNVHVTVEVMFHLL